MGGVKVVMYRSEWLKVILRVKVAGRVMISVWVGWGSAFIYDFEI